MVIELIAVKIDKLPQNLVTRFPEVFSGER